MCYVKIVADVLKFAPHSVMHRKTNNADGNYLICILSRPYFKCFGDYLEI